MKRKRLRLSFDEESEDGASDASGPGGGGDELQAASRRRKGGLPQRTPLVQSGQLAAGPASNEEVRAEDLAQITALRAALGLVPKGSAGKADAVGELGSGPAPPSNGEVDEDGGRRSPSPSPQMQLPSSLGKIQTFAEFLRLSPAIKEAAPELPAEELTSLCETAARLRFFDRELFEEVFRHIRAKVRAREFSVEQVTAVAASLVEVNAYDAEIFGAAASMLLPLVSQLSKAQRLMWIKTIAIAGHRSDEAFEVALRTLPLPGGLDVSSADDFMLCWDYVKTGACPRGARCRWTHPRAVKPAS